MTNPQRISLILACALSLCGCLVPERFSARVDLNPDASYSFRYAGTVVHALAAAQLKKTGTLSDKDRTGLQTDAKRLAAAPDVLRAIYMEDGRFELEIASKKKAGEPLRMLNIFSVSTDRNGVITITSPEIKDKDQQELQQLGIAINGTLEVHLPANAKVLSHNATSSPSFFGLFGGYTWKIGRVDQRPQMQVKVN